MLKHPLLEARITNSEDGMAIAARSMAASMALIGLHSENIANSGVPGYQAKRPVQRPFIEYLGVNSVEYSVSEEVGRVRHSGQASDFALSSEGYFQLFDARSGQVQTTRDGRAMVDKEGFLRNLQGAYFLDPSGSRIQFPTVPTNFAEQVKVERDGKIIYHDPASQTTVGVGQFSVVSATGGPVSKVDVAQGFVEDSNVFLAREFAGVLPKRRDFEANSNLFKLQSGNLQRMIQELGRVQ